MTRILSCLPEEGYLTFKELLNIIESRRLNDLYNINYLCTVHKERIFNIKKWLQSRESKNIAQAILLEALIKETDKRQVLLEALSKKRKEIQVSTIQEDIVFLNKIINGYDKEFDNLIARDTGSLYDR